MRLLDSLCIAALLCSLSAYAESAAPSAATLQSGMDSSVGALNIENGFHGGGGGGFHGPSGPGPGFGGGGGGFHGPVGPAPGFGGGGYHGPVGPNPGFHGPVGPGYGPNPGFHGPVGPGYYGPGYGPVYGGGYYGPRYYPPFNRGGYPWPVWNHPVYEWPVYSDWQWDSLVSVTCSAVDSQGQEFPVTESGYSADEWQVNITAIQEAALNQCYADTNGDEACAPQECVPSYY